ncbi:hypothetical protein DD985_22000 [Pseudomonas sp. HMWF011]|nr:hypothetical protein C7A09_23685 [Pseudomonas fluorescens]PTT14902.1 hypothetical protein DBR14_02580 [Pseudomonas sp. HMWF034]PVV67193.1 hypothetical protein DD985_22000 [Pseudomonas sp. HMWF011]TKK36916.1 hypothetical protein PflCFBP13517_27080 [Pseudomonas fluorescens]
MGAGLPAMQTPGCISDTQVMLSQASQLPHWTEPDLALRPGRHPWWARSISRRASRSSPLGWER